MFICSLVLVDLARKFSIMFTKCVDFCMETHFSKSFSHMGYSVPIWFFRISHRHYTQFHCSLILAATKQLYKWFSPSVRLSHHFTMFPSSYHHEISKSVTNDRSEGHAWVKMTDRMCRSQRPKTYLALSRPYFQFKFTYGDEMMRKAWCCSEEVT